MTDVLMDYCECMDAAINDCADLSMTDDLQNAVMISLFTDARARVDDVLPNQNDRGGYWGGAIDGNNWGSRLWLLQNARDLPETYKRAQDYAREALVWLVADGVASKVDVTASKAKLENCTFVLAFEVKIYKPQKVIGFNFAYAWQLNKVLSCGKIGE
jgi:phage gp46-like protein